MNSPTQPNSASPQVPEPIPEWADRIALDVMNLNWPKTPARENIARIAMKHAPQPATAGETPKLPTPSVFPPTAQPSDDWMHAGHYDELKVWATKKITALTAERDAAQAKVGELEAQLESPDYFDFLAPSRDFHSWMEQHGLESCPKGTTAERDAAQAKVGELESVLRYLGYEIGTDTREGDRLLIDEEKQRSVTIRLIKGGQAAKDQSELGILRAEADKLTALEAEVARLKEDLHKEADAGRHLFSVVEIFEEALNEIRKTEGLCDSIARQAMQRVEALSLTSRLTPPAQGSVELLATIRAIKAEAERCGEYNPCSGKTRLPKGYQQIISLCESALTPATEGKR